MNLDRFRRRAAGPGTPLLVATALAQGLLVFLLVTAPPPPTPAPAPLGLAAAAVVEPGDGSPPVALGPRAVEVEGARLQITFEAERDAWVSVLWFDGPERVVSLYPNVSRGETGRVTGGRTYAVPGEATYLRLTPTGPDGDDWLAVVASEAPDPGIAAVLARPTPEAVAALRARLVDEARARTSADGATERFLPTADGRAVAVAWEQVRGFGRLVYGRSVRVVGRGWADGSPGS